MAQAAVCSLYRCVQSVLLYDYFKSLKEADESFEGHMETIRKEKYDQREAVNVIAIC